MRRITVGVATGAATLAVAGVGIAQINSGVPSADQRAGSPATALAPGWQQKILATGAQPLENPVGIFAQYGYLNDTQASVSGCTPAYVPQASGLKTKTEPDQNTYLVTTSNPGGPSAGYDYGRHFLVQGHELFSNAGAGVGQTNSAYITRINLDVPLNDKHRITLLGMTAGADNCDSGMASLDGSTYDPFNGKLLFTGEAGGTSGAATSYGGVYATDLNWGSTTAPAVAHSSLQQSFGHAGYEGIQVDDKGSIVTVEDTSGSTVSSGVKNAKGYVYRFVPSDPTDLTKGILQALQVSVDGTPLTAASQDPIAGTPDKRLYSGETLAAQWVDVHDSTGAAPPANFDANAEAAAASATPFKRPENVRFVPGSGFKSFVFTVTGDTAANAIDAQPDRAAAGALIRVDMPASGATAATVHAIAPGDGEHAAYDSITFLDKDTLLVGEDRGDGLHASYDALDSTWSFDLTKSFSQQLTSAQRLIAQGRDPEATDDVARREASPPVADQNDGDNEVTGLLVSDGISTVSSVFGTNDPAAEPGRRIFYTGQHGANVTYELLPPAPASGVPGPAGAPGAPGAPGTPGASGTNGSNGTNGTNGTNGAAGTNGANGTNGATGPAGAPGKDGQTILCRVTGKKVTCSSVRSASRAAAARLIRGRVTYARGTVARMTRVRTVRRGTYTLLVGRGHAARGVRVVVR